MMCHRIRVGLLKPCLVVLVLAVFAGSAQAYYNPSLGRFLTRDPGPGQGGGRSFIPRDTPGAGYQDGMNLYQYVRSNPIRYVDPLGLNLYAIDGTLSDTGDKHNTKRFYDLSQETSYYWEGPDWAATGLDSGSILRGVKKQICEDKCADINTKVNLVGWSRGATIAMEVAEELNKPGACCCPDGTNIGYVSVNWIGLFDAVDMTLTTGWTDTIPDNVKNASHVVKSKSQLIFPTTNYDVEEPRLTDSTVVELENSDHGDVGESSDVALHWMVQQAQAAGVNMQDVPTNYTEEAVPYFTAEELASLDKWLDDKTISALSKVTKTVLKSGGDDE